MFNPWVRKIPWSREWLFTIIFLPGKFCGQRSLAGYNPCACKESDMTELLSTLSPEKKQEGRSRGEKERTEGSSVNVNRELS